MWSEITYLTHTGGSNTSSFRYVVLQSLAAPSFMHGAWPCLVWSGQGVCFGPVKPLVAGRSVAESRSAVMDSSRSSCTCHWLSNRLSGPWKQEGTGGEVCVCAPVNVCSGVRGCSREGWGALIGMSLLHGLCMCEGESKRGGMRTGWGGGSVSNSWAGAGVTVRLPGLMNLQRDTQYKSGFIFTPRIDLSHFYTRAFGLKKQSIGYRWKCQGSPL